MKKYIKYFSSLWLSSLLSSVLAFLLQAVLARVLTPSGLGEFNSLLTYLLIFGSIAGFGVDNGLLKIFGRGKRVGNQFGANIVLYSLLTTSLSFLFVLTTSVFIFTDVNLSNLLILSPVLISLVSFNLRSAVLQIEGRYHDLAIWQIINNFSKLFFISLLYFDLVGVKYIYHLYSSSSIVILAFSISSFLKVYKGRILQVEVGFNKITIDGLKEICKISIPFGSAAIAHTIYFQSDIFLLSYLDSAESAGFYSIAFSILTAVYLFPAVIYQKVLLPRIHEWSNHNKTMMLVVFQQGNGIMLILGVLAALMVYFFGGTLILILFGDKYITSIEYISLLTICIPIRFLISGLGAVLSTGDLIKRKLNCMIIVAMFNAFLNLLFIPHYGVYAAIITTILSEILLAALFLSTIYFKLFGKDTFKYWFRFGGGINNA
ncbi:oligosaccharide flippase family protein [Photobacterium sp. 53610]|uniref:oligosaccharide flippase family protein n=1 Tax=Photobacterium sp. 53610 TaxID=3102789 RepID=UPI002ED94079